MQLWVGDRLVNGATGRVHQHYQHLGVATAMYAKCQEMSLLKLGSPLTYYGEYFDTPRTRRQVAHIPGYIVQREWVRYLLLH